MRSDFIKTERADSTATHELIFQAAHLPPLGHKSYYVVKTASRSTGLEDQATTVHHPKAKDEVFITNQVNR